MRIVAIKTDIPGRTVRVIVEDVINPLRRETFDFACDHHLAIPFLAQALAPPHLRASALEEKRGGAETQRIAESTLSSGAAS